MLMMMPPLFWYFWFHSIYSLAASCSLQSANVIHRRSIQTFCDSPNSFHLRADCSLCNTTLKPLTTKIQCYTVLIYSTCNQIKTSSCSSSYSRYYELVYLSVCVLVVFSGRALTVVLEASFCFCAIQLLDLYRSEAEFVVVYLKTVTRDHSNAIF